MFTFSVPLHLSKKKSQSRLQLLLFPVEIPEYFLFDSRSLFKSQQSVHFATLSWCQQPSCIFHLQLNFPSSKRQNMSKTEEAAVCFLFTCQYQSPGYIYI